jgi:hypothetical protein
LLITNFDKLGLKTYNNLPLDFFSLFLGVFQSKNLFLFRKGFISLLQINYDPLIKEPTNITKEYLRDIKDYQYFRDNLLEPPYERISKLQRDPHKIRPQSIAKAFAVDNFKTNYLNQLGLYSSVNSTISTFGVLFFK